MTETAPKTLSKPWAIALAVVGVVLLIVGLRWDMITWERAEGQVCAESAEAGEPRVLECDEGILGSLADIITGDKEQRWK